MPATLESRHLKLYSLKGSLLLTSTAEADDQASEPLLDPQLLRHGELSIHAVSTHSRHHNITRRLKS